MSAAAPGLAAPAPDGPSHRLAPPAALGLHGAALKTRPPRPARGVIPRPRLDALRELVRTRLLTLVTAPPGYGKTSVALAWSQALAAEGAQVAWLRLDDDDDDPDRFFALLAKALDHACRHDGDEPAWAPAEFAVPEAQRLEWLLERLAPGCGEVVLVVDDVHLLRSEAALRPLQALLRLAPERLHLVLLARRAPPLALATLRARDELLELHADTLAFDVAETEQLLRRSRADAVAPGEAVQLQSYTGGWAAALRAALLTAHLQPPAMPAAAAAPAAAPRPVQAMFAELLEQLPPAERDFVECTTLPERICAPLAERLSGRADAAARLEAIERQQLFVTAVDDAGGCEFHRLFRDFVQRQLRERDPARARRLHRTAAAWFAEAGDWGPAIGHALAGADTAQALAWIEQHAMSLVGAGDLLTLLAWERQLRAHLVQSPRRLRLAFAWGLALSMACDRALALLDGVEAELDSAEIDAEAMAALRDECLALRAVLVTTTGDYELGEQLARRVPERERPLPWVANAVRNVKAAAHLHGTRWQQLYASEPLVGDAARRLHLCDAMSLAYRLSIHGLAEYRQGQLDSAATLLAQAMVVGAAQGARGRALVALPAPTLALVHYERDALAEAARVNAEHFEVNRRVAPIEGLFAAYLVAARLARLAGQPARARHLLDEGEGIGAARGWRRVVVAMRLERLRHCLLDGRVAESAASVDGLAALATPGPGRPALDCRDFARAAAVAAAWRELADGSALRAAGMLSAERDHAAAAGRTLDELQLTVSLALARRADGAEREALTLFAAACRRAMALGALRSLADQPVPLAPLLARWRALRETFAPDAALDRYVAALEAAATAEPGRPRVAAASPVETLSPREHHILRLLAEGGSNKEIARRLGIAPETVKTHVSKIFGKLGASNRAQAAAMMR